MPKIELDKTAQAGHVLFRYMRAGHRFKNKVEPPLPAHELAQLIGGGKEEFDEIYIEAAASPPVVFDGKGRRRIRGHNQEKISRDCVLGPAAGSGLAALHYQRRASTAKTGAAESMIRRI
jgi:hypothetical protein